MTHIFDQNVDRKFDQKLTKILTEILTETLTNKLTEICCSQNVGQSILGQKLGKVEKKWETFPTKMSDQKSDIFWRSFDMKYFVLRMFCNQFWDRNQRKLRKKWRTKIYKNIYKSIKIPKNTKMQMTSRSSQEVKGSKMSYSEVKKKLI